MTCAEVMRKPSVEMATPLPAPIGGAAAGPAANLQVGDAGAQGLGDRDHDLRVRVERVVGVGVGRDRRGEAGRFD